MVWWRTTLYAVFALLAAPLQFHVEWSLAYFRELAPSLWYALASPLQHGALFYYSMILVVETNFRLEMHDYLAERTACRALKLLSYLMVVPFLVFLISDPAQSLGETGIRTQLYVAVVSLVLAFGAHLYLLKTDHLLRKAATA